MDRTFKFSSHLTLARQFLTAGGGVARKLLDLQRIRDDLTKTSWIALLYVANFPTKHNTEQSIKRLKELAAKAKQHKSSG